MEDILDDDGYRSLGSHEKVAWIDLLAIFNRRKAHLTGNTITLAWSAAMTTMGAQNRRGACARAARIARGTCAGFARTPRGLLCHIPKWAEMQGMAPVPLREIPLTTPTPTPTPNKKKSTKKKRAPSKATKCPDQLTEEQRSQIAAWAQRKGYPSTGEALEHGWERFHRWAKDKPPRASWYSSFQNAIEDGWCFRGFNGPGAPIDRAKMTFEEIDAANQKESNRKLLEKSHDNPGTDSGALGFALRSLPERRR